MSKRELIDAIRMHNRTVSPEFLARFGENDLKAYLDRICVTTATAPPARMQARAEGKNEMAVV
jgi:hypothetical protein